MSDGKSTTCWDGRSSSYLWCHDGLSRLGRAEEKGGEVRLHAFNVTQDVFIGYDKTRHEATSLSQNIDAKGTPSSEAKATKPLQSSTVCQRSTGEPGRPCLMQDTVSMWRLKGHLFEGVLDKSVDEASRFRYLITPAGGTQGVDPSWPGSYK